MPKSKTPVLQLIPSSGKRLKEVSATVDFLVTILGGLIPAILAKHPQFKDLVVGDLKAMRDSRKWPPDQQAAFDKAIRVFDGFVVIHKRKK